MSHSDLDIAGFYDHEHETVDRAPDWGGDELFAGPPLRRFQRANPAPSRATAPAAVAAPAVAPERFTPSAAYLPAADDAIVPVPAGRRTVTITGHPGAVATRPHRPLDAGPRRPARSLEERLMHRPERIAAWSFGMGLLLILLAIVTAH